MSIPPHKLRPESGSLGPTLPAEAGSRSEASGRQETQNQSVYNDILFGTEHLKAAGPKSEIQPQADPAG